MSLIEICNRYFEVFSNKDLAGLESLFASNVTLRDWDITASGKDDLLKTNENIFNAVDSIRVKVLKIYEDGNTIVSELEIDINNGGEILRVVDVIEFDTDGKISAIRAYKG